MPAPSTEGFTTPWGGCTVARMTTTLPHAETAYEAIEGLADSGLPAQDLLDEVAQRIDRVVPSDGFFLGATDPETTLAIGMGVARDLPEELCQPTWEYEFLVPDFLKFVDIASSGRAVADLHEATGGRPERSARWREYAAATGYASEIRATFNSGGATWAIAQFNRLGDAPRFSDDEKTWLERVAPLVARGLRRALVAQPAAAPAGRGPGIVLLDLDGAIVSATREAEAWLDDIDPWLGIPQGRNVLFPFEAHAYVSSVRAAAGIGEPAPRARLRTRSGVWLLMHGSLLPGTDQLALVIEPAKASDVAPLIVEAYGLTQRELEVTRAVARGLGTGEIAASLFLSPHTVRDHLKGIFEKVGVSSRGELVAKVFADHYAPIPHAN
jgi:DNA-binding CsgD family transcriptional regulator